MSIASFAGRWIMPLFLAFGAAAILVDPGYREVPWSAAAIMLLTVGTLGALSTGLVSRVVAADIRAIRVPFQANGPGGGAANPGQRPWIREARELGETIALMEEVLGDAHRRARAAPIDAHRRRARPDLAQRYVERFAPPLTMSVGGARVIGGRVGVAAGHFCGASAVEGGCVAFLGGVRSSGDVEAAVDASAAETFLRQHLRHGSVERALGSCARTFPLAALTAVFVPSTSAQAVIYTIPYGSIKESVVPLRAGDPPLLLHSIGADEGGRLEELARVFRGLPLDAYARDVLQIATGNGEGVVLLVARG